MTSRTKWTIIISAAVLIIAGAVALFIYEHNSIKVFMRSEYVKEVVLQKTSFDGLMDQYLDQVRTYNGSSESAAKVQGLANRLYSFVAALQSNLGPRVPAVSRDHYNAMIAAYQTYLDAVNLYQQAVSQNLGDQRTALMNQADAKMTDAQNAMNNLP